MSVTENSPSILIVEDEDLIADVIALKLDFLGYRSAGRTPLGEEAVTLAASLRPDLVLMDIFLAGKMDGIAAAQAIKDEFDIPVVFLTSYSSEELLARAKLSDPFGYLLKPFTESELRIVIEIALYKHQVDARRKQIEIALGVSLLEKEALLKEMHHRVKNNLQVIFSLLGLEVGRSTQDETRMVLGDMQSRIRTMALLHESLFRSSTFSSLDLAAYLRQLSTQVFSTMRLHADALRLELDLDAVTIGMDQATPCGLLVNELISNSLKHGFPEGRSGEIRLELHTIAGTNQVHLKVSDTGIGLSTDFEEKRQHSLGLQLAVDLAKQIGGELTISRVPQLSFELRFAIKEINPLVLKL